MPQTTNEAIVILRNMRDYPEQCGLPATAPQQQALAIALEIIEAHSKTERVPLADVYNMTSPRGNREVPNQFIITTEAGQYFKSYNSIIAFIPSEHHKVMNGIEYKTVLDERYWDYSTTTGKYRNQFLGEGIEDTRRKIKSGEYLLANLN